MGYILHDTLCICMYLYVIVLLQCSSNRKLLLILTFTFDFMEISKVKQPPRLGRGPQCVTLKDPMMYKKPHVKVVLGDLGTTTAVEGQFQDPYRVGLKCFRMKHCGVFEDA